MAAETNWENVPAPKWGLMPKGEDGKEPDVYVPSARKEYQSWPKLKTSDVYDVSGIARPVLLVSINHLCLVDLVIIE